MPTNPADYQGERIPDVPYDENRKPVAPLFGATVSGGDIAGYLPLRVVDNGDGTATLKVDTELELDGNVYIDNLKIGSSDGQVSGNKFLKVDEEGRVFLNPNGTVLETNSTVTPLGAGETFTGTFIDVTSVSHITVQINTDQDSAVDGFTVEWSQDGTIVDGSDTFTLVGDPTKVYSFAPESRFFRVRYINGSTPQGIFRLQSISKGVYQKHSTHNVRQSIVEDDDATLTKSVITIQDPNSNIFHNVMGPVLLGIPHVATVSADVHLELSDTEKLFTSSFDVAIPGTTESPYVLLRNPAGNNKHLYLDNSTFDLLTKGRQCVWRYYTAPTVTAVGTLQIARCTKLSSTPPSSTMLVYSLPSVSSNGAKLLSLSSGADVNSLERDHGFALILEPGQDLLITSQPTVTNTNSGITLSWGEV